MSSMKSNTTAKDREEATGAGDGDGASAGNITAVNAPTEPSEVEGESSAGTNNNNNDNEREQEREQSSSLSSSSSSSHRNQVQHQQEQQGDESTDSVTSSSARSATARTRPDAFRIYSDDDTRMLELLGLEASANPNVNWRQLVGLSAAGQERRRSDVNAENRDTPRRTRLSYELHPDVFYEMWFGHGGEFDLNDGAAAARNDVLAERRGQGQGGRQEQDNDDDDNEDLDDGGV